MGEMNMQFIDNVLFLEAQNLKYLNVSRSPMECQKCVWLVPICIVHVLGSLNYGVTKSNEKYLTCQF